MKVINRFFSNFVLLFFLFLAVGTQTKASTNSLKKDTLNKIFEANKGSMHCPLNDVNQSAFKSYLKGVSVKPSGNFQVYSAFEGEVTLISKIRGKGKKKYKIVIIQSGDYRTVYSNLSKVNLKKGDAVSQGQIIGEIYKEDKDLYFEMRNGVEIIDPLEWVRCR